MSNYPKIPFAPPPFNDLATDVVAASKLGIIPQQIGSLFKLTTAQVKEILEKAKSKASSDG
jgi:hypothetical protein